MSGLRSIADWALGGGSGASNDDDLPPVEGPSEDELRAKRMARLAALETTSRSNSAPKSDDTSANVDNMDVDGVGDTGPMEVDESTPRSSLLSTTSSKRKTSPVSVAPHDGYKVSSSNHHYTSRSGARGSTRETPST